MKQDWYVYILKCKDDTFYTGVTTDIARRLEEHNTSPKGAKYTSTRRPAILVYQETYPTRSLAQKQERLVQGLKRSIKMALVATYKDSSIS